MANFASVAISASGQYIVTGDDDGYIYLSSNYGATFTEIRKITVSFNSVKMSSSGEYMTAVTSDGIIFTSTNYGNNFNIRIDLGVSVTSVAMSSTGQYQIASISSTNILYASYDYGNIWTPSTVASYSSLSMSSSGQYITALRNPGDIYTSNYPLPSSTTKTFIIDHPIEKEKYLVHACLEGPEVGVYYRGVGEISNNHSKTIELPEYVSSIANNFTVQITPITKTINNNTTNKPKKNILKTSKVKHNQFTVYGENGEFFWKVYGTRMLFEVEPFKNKVSVKGDGPYKWIS